MEPISNWLSQQNPWEWLAMVLAIAYLWLIIKERIEAWYCALASTAIYTILFWHVSLLMESALNVYYMAMAVYGWWLWQFGGDNQKGVAVQVWPWQKHALCITLIFTCTASSGWLLSHNTQAAHPYIDSFTTWAAVLTTYLVAQKILANWLYWIVINSISVWLYIDRGLYPTSILFIGYVAMSFVGYYRWRKVYNSQHNAGFIHEPKVA